MNTTELLDDIKYRLRVSGLTQSEIGKRAGITQAAIHKLYKRDAPPKLKTVIDLWPLVYGAEFPEIASMPLPNKAAKDSPPTQRKRKDVDPTSDI